MTQPYAPPPQQQPYYPPPRPPQQGNGLATAGFVVALVGAVLALIPIIGIVAWVVAPLGLILSIVGLSRAGQLGGRGLAVAGTVLGAVGLIICIGWVTALANAPTSTSSSAPRTYSTPSYALPSTQVAAPTTSAMPSVNGPFTSGTYLVGDEIAAGSYRTDGSGTLCYWSRLENTSGEVGAINANGFADGPTTITVQAGDEAVEFSGSCTWTRR